MFEIFPLYLILSLLATFLLLFMIYPKQKKVMRYPNINDPISDLYIDENNVCYRYHREEYTGY